MKIPEYLEPYNPYDEEALDRRHAWLIDVARSALDTQDRAWAIDLLMSDPYFPPERVPELVDAAPTPELQTAMLASAERDAKDRLKIAHALCAEMAKDAQFTEELTIVKSLRKREQKAEALLGQIRQKRAALSVRVATLSMAAHRAIRRSRPRAVQRARRTAQARVACGSGSADPPPPYRCSRSSFAGSAVLQ